MKLFQEEGYSVTTTNFAPNSFAQIEALQPDALIIDIAIGQEAGWELSWSSWMRMPTPPVSRSWWSPPIPGCWPTAGAHARCSGHRFLEKPLDLEAMLGAIREMLAAG